MSRLHPWIQKCPAEVAERLRQLATTTMYLVRETGPMSFIIAEEGMNEKQSRSIVHSSHNSHNGNSLGASVTSMEDSNSRQNDVSNNHAEGDYIQGGTAPNSGTSLQTNESRQRLPCKYKVRVGSFHKCSCGQPSPCIHILYVFCKVFRVPDNNPLIWQQSLIDHEINQILQGRTNMSNLTRKQGRGKVKLRQLEEGDICPICQDDMHKTDYLVSCFACGQYTHSKCMKVWADHRQKCHEPITCSLCRSEWSPTSLTSLLTSNRRRYISSSTHNGCKCDGCSIIPIVGDRFKCSICAEYNLCSQCFHHKSIHTQHPFDKKSGPEEPWIPTERMIQPENSHLQHRNCTTSHISLRNDHQNMHSIQVTGAFPTSVFRSNQTRNSRNMDAHGNNRNLIHNRISQAHLHEANPSNPNLSIVSNSLQQAAERNTHAPPVQQAISRTNALQRATSTRTMPSSRHDNSNQHTHQQNPSNFNPLLLELMTREINPNDYELLLELDTPVKKGVSDQVLKLLPKIPINHFNLIDFEDEACPICLSSYELDDVLCHLHCNHYYHMDCITKWLEDHNSCCVCNHEVIEYDYSFPEMTDNEIVEESLPSDFTLEYASNPMESENRSVNASTESVDEDLIISMNDELADIDESIVHTDTTGDDFYSYRTQSLSSIASLGLSMRGTGRNLIDVNNSSNDDLNSNDLLIAPCRNTKPNQKSGKIKKGITRIESAQSPTAQSTNIEISGSSLIIPANSRVHAVKNIQSFTNGSRQSIQSSKLQKSTNKSIKRESAPIINIYNGTSSLVTQPFSTLITHKSTPSIGTGKIIHGLTNSTLKNRPLLQDSESPQLMIETTAKSPTAQTSVKLRLKPVIRKSGLSSTNKLDLKENTKRFSIEDGHEGNTLLHVYSATNGSIQQTFHNEERQTEKPSQVRRIPSTVQKKFQTQTCNPHSQDLTVAGGQSKVNKNLMTRKTEKRKLTLPSK